MKHIKDILAERQLSLFRMQPTRKGSSEWSTFEAVTGDRVDSHPTKPGAWAGAGYKNVVRVRRMERPQPLYPRHAH